MTRRLPRPTPLGDALLLTILLLALGLALAVTRAGAQEADDAPRYEPTSRGVRAAVLARSEVEAIAADVFGPDLAPYVAAIAWCESRHRPAALNAGWDRFYGAYRYVGLMQIEAGIWTPLAVELTGSDDLTDPVVNLTVARDIQRRQGWGAWPYCSRWAW